MREKRHLLARTASVWLIASSVLIGLVVATGLGRHALSAATTRLGSPSPTVHSAANDVSCFDTSPHKTLVVSAAPDVQLEVLNWGGAGDPMVLLTGAGDNAHVYDEFAYQFTDRIRVIGITRYIVEKALVVREMRKFLLGN